MNNRNLDHLARFTRPEPEEAELADLVFAALGAVILVGLVMLVALS